MTELTRDERIIHQIIHLNWRVAHQSQTRTAWARRWNAIMYMIEGAEEAAFAIDSRANRTLIHEFRFLWATAFDNMGNAPLGLAD